MTSTAISHSPNHMNHMHQTGDAQAPAWNHGTWFWVTDSVCGSKFRKRSVIKIHVSKQKHESSGLLNWVMSRFICTWSLGYLIWLKLGIFSGWYSFTWEPLCLSMPVRWWVHHPHFALGPFVRTGAAANGASDQEIRLWEVLIFFSNFKSAWNVWKLGRCLSISS